MNLTSKYPNCQNCGANNYEMNSLNTVKCEYCGSEYEIEMPKPKSMPINLYAQPIGLTCITGTIPIYKI